jgi:hypothetical protein
MRELHGHVVCYHASAIMEFSSNDYAKITIKYYRVTTLSRYKTKILIEKGAKIKNHHYNAACVVAENDKRCHVCFSAHCRERRHLEFDCADAKQRPNRRVYVAG